MNEDFWLDTFWATDFWAENFWRNDDSVPGGGSPDGAEGMTEDEFRRYRKIVASNPRR